MSIASPSAYASSEEPRADAKVMTPDRFGSGARFAYALSVGWASASCLERPGPSLRWTGASAEAKNQTSKET